MDTGIFIIENGKIYRMVAPVRPGKMPQRQQVREKLSLVQAIGFPGNRAIGVELYVRGLGQFRSLDALTWTEEQTPEAIIVTYPVRFVVMGQEIHRTLVERKPTQTALEARAAKEEKLRKEKRRKHVEWLARAMTPQNSLWCVSYMKPSEHNQLWGKKGPLAAVRHMSRALPWGRDPIPGLLTLEEQIRLRDELWSWCMASRRKQKEAWLAEHAVKEEG